MLSTGRIQLVSKCSCGFPHIYAKFCGTFPYSSTGVLIQLLTLWENDEVCTFEMFCKISCKITNSGSNISTWKTANVNKRVAAKAVLQGLRNADV